MGKRGTENLVNLPNVTQVVSGRASLALGCMLSIPFQGLALLSLSWVIWEMGFEVLIEQHRGIREREFGERWEDSGNGVSLSQSYGKERNLELLRSGIECHASIILLRPNGKPYLKKSISSSLQIFVIFKCSFSKHNYYAECKFFPPSFYDFSVK